MLGMPRRPKMDFARAVEDFRDYLRRLKEHPDADPIELLHGHVCGPRCWHNLKPSGGPGDHRKS